MTTPASTEIASCTLETLAFDGSVSKHVLTAIPDPSVQALESEERISAFRYYGDAPIFFEDGTACRRQSDDGLYESGWYFIRYRIFDYLNPPSISPLRGPIRGKVDAALRQYGCTHLIVLLHGGSIRTNLASTSWSLGSAEVHPRGRGN